MHVFQALVDTAERLAVRHVFIDLEVALQVAVHNTRQLRPALDTTKRRALPLAARHKLERPRRDFLAGLGHTNDRRYTPSLVARLQGRAHHMDVARAVKRVVETAVGDRNEMLHHRISAFDTWHVLRVDKLSRAKRFGPRFLGRIHVNGNDALGAALLRTVRHGKTDAAHTPDCDR